MRFLKGLLIGLILGVAAGWYIAQKASQHPEAEQRAKDSAARAGAAASDAASNLGDALKAEYDSLDLHPDQIKDEMKRTGGIVKRKAKEIAGQVADATADARIVTAIKAKYAADADLSVWSISVSSTDGRVALSGTVPTAEGVGKAVALALKVSGVVDVTSTLEIKPK